MLRREIRAFVLITTLMLLFILFYQLNFTNTHGKLDSRMEFADYTQGRNLKSYWEHRKSMKKNVEVHYCSETLPTRSVINHVNCFLFFVGYARSGHSIIASMIDAHPNVVIVRVCTVCKMGA